MRRGLGKKLMLGLALSLGRALAADTGEGFAVELGGSYNTYAMADWNSYASLLGVSSGTASASAGGLYNGFGYGAGVRYLFPGGFEAGAEAEMLMGGASTWINITGTVQTLKYQLNALYFGPQARYCFASYESAFYTVGGGAGLIMLSGAGSSTDDTGSYYFGGGGNSSSTTYSGSGYGGKIFVGADWLTGENFSLTAKLGYRIAVIPEFNDSNGKMTKSNGSPMSLDYSGMILAFGIAWWP